MTSRTDDYHCPVCKRYQFSAYTVHMSAKEKRRLEENAKCPTCKPMKDSPPYRWPRSDKKDGV